MKLSVWSGAALYRGEFVCSAGIRVLRCGMLVSLVGCAVGLMGASLPRHEKVLMSWSQLDLHAVSLAGEAGGVGGGECGK